MARVYVNNAGQVVNETGKRQYVNSRGQVVNETMGDSGLTTVSADLASTYEVHAKVFASFNGGYYIASASETVLNSISGSYKVMMAVVVELAGVSITVTGAGISSFTSDSWGNNTMTPLNGVSVSYSWYPNGRIGNLTNITPIEGTGVLNAQNKLVLTSLPSGPGFMFGVLLGANPQEDAVFYQAGVAT